MPQFKPICQNQFNSQLFFCTVSVCAYVSVSVFVFVSQYCIVLVSCMSLSPSMRYLSQTKRVNYTILALQGSIRYTVLIVDGKSEIVAHV